MYYHNNTRTTDTSMELTVTVLVAEQHKLTISCEEQAKYYH